MTKGDLKSNRKGHVPRNRLYRRFLAGLNGETGQVGYKDPSFLPGLGMHRVCKHDFAQSLGLLFKPSLSI